MRKAVMTFTIGIAVLAVLAILHIVMWGGIHWQWGHFGLTVRNVDRPFQLLFLSFFVMVLSRLPRGWFMDLVSRLREDRPPVLTVHTMLGVILFVGLMLRLSGMAGHEFQICDEGLYTHCGKEIAHDNNVMLKYVWVDKPPAYFYLVSLFYGMFGFDNDIARMPNILASLLLVLLVFELGKRWFSPHVGLIAALLQAINPIDTVHAGYALLDTTLTLWLLLSLVCTDRKSVFLGGLCFSIACATKQTAFLFFPAVIAHLWLRFPGFERWRLFRTWFLGYLPGTALLFWWSISVNELAMIQQQSQSYGGVRFVPWLESLWRLRNWARLHAVTNFPAIDIGLGLLSVAGLLTALVNRIRRRVSPRYQPAPEAFTSPNRMTLFLFITVLLFLMLLTFVRFLQHQRYFVSLVPFICLALASSALGIRQLRKPAALALLVIVLLVQSFVHYGQRVVILEDYEGLDEICSYIRAVAAPNSRIYEHRLEWHLYSQFYDHPIDMSRYDRTDGFRDLGNVRENNESYLIDDIRDHLPITDIQATMNAENIALTRVRDGFDGRGRLRYVLYRVLSMDELERLKHEQRGEH